MDKITTIKNHIEQIFDEDVYLYAIDYIYRDNMHILEVQIDRKSSSVDLDLCSEISEKISTILDDLDLIEEEYYLEVCSAGAEKQIRNEEELQDALNQYIYVQLINPKNGLDEILGTLIAIDEETITLEYFIKGVRKKTVIDQKNIQYISHAVKV